MLFQELAPKWNAKLRELEYLDNNSQTPELHKYGSCIIGECATKAKIETFKLNKGDPLPKCYFCLQMARHPIIMDIGYGHNVKSNIARFYKELVPQIVGHYERDHKVI